SFGISAGARLTTMRPLGNSNPEERRAKRTRSRLSRTTVAGRPTNWNAGRPLVTVTSTCTSGASRPTWARHRRVATGKDTHRPWSSAAARIALVSGRLLRGSVAGDTGCSRGRRALERLQPRLELREPGAGAFEHAHLRVELVPGHQVELAEARAQHCAEVGFEILADGAKSRRNALQQPARDLIDAEVVHHFSPPSAMPFDGAKPLTCGTKTVRAGSGGNASHGKCIGKCRGMDSAPRLPASPAYARESRSCSPHSWPDRPETRPKTRERPGDHMRTASILSKAIRRMTAVTALATLAPTLAWAADAPIPNKGDTAWMLTSTALVLLMSVPALGLFYGGLVRTKNMLSVLMQVFVG